MEGNVSGSYKTILNYEYLTDPKTHLVELNGMSYKSLKPLVDITTMTRHTHTCTYTHTHIHTYKHTSTQIFVPSPPPPPQKKKKNKKKKGVVKIWRESLSSRSSSKDTLFLVHWCCLICVSGMWSVRVEHIYKNTFTIWQLHNYHIFCLHFNEREMWHPVVCYARTVLLDTLLLGKCFVSSGLRYRNSRFTIRSIQFTKVGVDRLRIGLDDYLFLSIRSS